MHVHPHVALLGEQGLARVHSHANADRSSGERVLSRLGGRERVLRPRKGDEERVALCVDLDTAVARERLAQHPAMLGERI